MIYNLETDKYTLCNMVYKYMKISYIVYLLQLNSNENARKTGICAIFAYFLDIQ